MPMEDWGNRKEQKQKPKEVQVQKGSEGAALRCIPSTPIKHQGVQERVAEPMQSLGDWAPKHGSRAYNGYLVTGLDSWLWFMGGQGTRKKEEKGRGQLPSQIYLCRGKAQSRSGSSYLYTITLVSLYPRKGRGRHKGIKAQGLAIPGLSPMGKWAADAQVEPKTTWNWRKTPIESRRGPKPYADRWVL
ncbi:hypothetical protein LY76DRAFT_632786 [Colletotrichum caudatum]|nr:hypothetical protein LY76DRAFT_632786 [Colletotrichum caudatum]